MADFDLDKYIKTNGKSGKSDFDVNKYVTQNAVPNDVSANLLPSSSPDNYSMLASRE